MVELKLVALRSFIHSTNVCCVLGTVGVMAVNKASWLLAIMQLVWGDRQLMFKKQIKQENQVLINPLQK